MIAKGACCVVMREVFFVFVLFLNKMGNIAYFYANGKDSVDR